MARVISVDFTGVEAGSKFVRVKEGDYHLVLTAVKAKKGGDSGKPYLSATFKIKDGKTLAPHSFSLQKQSLWNLRNFLEACGKQVPSKAIKLDIDKLVDLECAGTVVDDEPYEGKVKSIISAFFPLADLGNTSESGDELEAEEETEVEDVLEAEEEAPPPKKTAAKKTKKKPPVEEDEPAEEEESSDEEDLFS